MYWKREIGYNISALAHRPEMNEETRKRMSESHQAEKNHMYGGTHTVEARKKISDAGLNLGEHHPSKRPESRAKKSELWIGEKNPSKRLEVRIKLSLAGLAHGENHSSKRPEVRKKMGRAGALNSRVKLEPAEVIEIRRLRKENPKFYTHKKLGEIFSVAKSTIQGIIENRSWTE